MDARPPVLRLAVAGLSLVAVTCVSCGLSVEDPERPATTLGAISVAALVAGAGPLALATFRVWRRSSCEAWPDTRQAAMLGFAGAGLAVGDCGGLMLSEGYWGAPSWIIGAVFALGLALSIGAAMLFAWAAAAEDPNPR